MVKIREIDADVLKLLELNRDSLNTRFHQRRKLGVILEADVWMHHLQSRVLPLVDHVRQVLPGQTNRALNELYDVALDLHGICSVSENSGYLPQLLNRLWESLLPRLAIILARDPRRVAGSMSNAIVKLARLRRGIAERWLESMGMFGPLVESVDQLLGLGQVVAWHSGMPAYRDGAINVARQLPKELVIKLLGIPEGFDGSQVNEILERLSSDRWSSALSAVATAEQAHLEQVCEFGAFRGFGGDFLSPPRVFAEKGWLYVTDSQSVWWIIADRHGWMLSRCEVHESGTSNNTSREQPRIDSNGEVHWEGVSGLFPHLANPASQAFAEDTFAITLSDSFKVFLIARREVSGTTR
jgi:hypothetical protein